MSNVKRIGAIGGIALLAALTTAPAALAAKDDGGVISGVIWHDLNGDGIRQPGEPPLAGFPVGDTKTGPDGRYRMTGLQDGASPYIDNGFNGLLPTVAHRGSAATDSDFSGYDNHAGPLTFPKNPDGSLGELKNIDAGFTRPRLDTTVTLTADKTDVREGDEVTLYAKQAALTGDPEQQFPFGVTIQAPAGWIITGYGPGGVAETKIDERTMMVQSLRYSEAKYEHTYQVTAKAGKNGGQAEAWVDEHAYTDTVPANNRAKLGLAVAAAPQPQGKPNPERPQLANTGATPVGALVAGGLVLVTGAGAVWYARRRKASTE
ncbi:LPXTG cell wall anchor domain-containing protein [Pseudonocardiaceae bacterium YIM PH 21723]|nr:LPXTG cell wall anchor domain-containing protein [Pseudonocardiaceae bacterium YIM PH 21723]